MTFFNFYVTYISVGGGSIRLAVKIFDRGFCMRQIILALGLMFISFDGVCMKHGMKLWFIYRKTVQNITFEELNELNRGY